MFELIKRDLIPISWLHTQDFCEYQLYLQHVLRIKLPATKEMLSGLQKHAELEQAFREKAAPIEEPIETHINKLLRGEIEPFSMREFSLKSEKYRLTGKIDEIQLFRERALIIDNKPSLSAKAADINQLRAYCLCFSDAYRWEGEICNAVQNSESQKFVFAERFNEDAKLAAEGLISRMHALFSGNADFSAADEKWKCAACRFNAVCKKAAYKPGQ
ncbi:MAG: PD-(D/E)XK nuclease family protein [Candidatus Diapherotrites archaeon]|nr:PD-(D/E)XK nuclease family protein [Candidatus Diapherotrites archaeon]